MISQLSCDKPEWKKILKKNTYVYICITELLYSAEEINTLQIKYNSLNILKIKCFKKRPPSKCFTNVFFIEQYSKYTRIF